MTTRIKIAAADVTFFEDRDGQSLWLVQASDADGREYTLGDEKFPLRPLPLHVAQRVAEKVKAAGDIDENLWSCRVPYGTNAWLIDGMEERQIADERFGY